MEQLIAMDPRREAQIQLMVRPLQAGMRAERLLAQIGVGDLSAAERLATPGIDGITGIARVNADGASRAVRITAIVVDDRGYLMTGLARAAARHAQFDPAFRDAAHSFHRLTDSERARPRPSAAGSPTSGRHLVAGTRAKFSDREVVAGSPATLVERGDSGRRGPGVKADQSGRMKAFRSRGTFATAGGLLITF
jgi:hypothetical protein